MVIIAVLSDSNDKDDYDDGADDGNKGGAVSSPGRRWLLGRAPVSKVSYFLSLFTIFNSDIFDPLLLQGSCSSLPPAFSLFLGKGLRWPRHLPAAYHNNTTFQ